MAIQQPSRLRVIGMIFIGAFAVYFLLNFFTGKSPMPNTTKVKMSGPPPLDSVPGSVKDNPRYKELQEKENQKRAEQAKKSGKSAMPTLVNKTEQTESDEDFFRDLKKEPAVEEDKKPKDDPLKKAQEDAERRLKEQQSRLDKLKKEQDDKRKLSEMARADTQRNQQEAKELEARVANYLTDIGGVSSAYGPVAKQAYVTSAANVGGKNLASVDQKPSVNAGPPLYKAGVMIYGVIETAYNSDDPGPVLARITTGPLAGSRLIGTVSNPASDWSAGLNISFNTMSRPLAERSQGINLKAVDPKTLQPSIATNVQYHYGQKYGALLLSGALTQGADQATNATQSNTSTSASSNTTTTNSSTSNGLSSLGTPVIDDIVKNLNKVASRPATYLIEPGTAVGLLFVNDFILEA